MLSLYREALRISAASLGSATARLRWLEAPDGVLAFARGEGFACAS